MRIAVETFVLPNGLRVILSRDHATPVVAVNLWYHVGSANEREGRTGFAHLFEHMLFQGSAQVGHGEDSRKTAVSATHQGSTGREERGDAAEQHRKHHGRR